MGKKRCGGCGVAETQDSLWPGVEGGADPVELERVGEHLVPLRGLRPPLVGPAFHQHGAMDVGAVDLDAFTGGHVDRGWLEDSPRSSPSRSSITRSASRCSVELPGGRACPLSCSTFARSPAGGWTSPVDAVMSWFTILRWAPGVGQDAYVMCEQSFGVPESGVSLENPVAGCSRSRQRTRWGRFGNRPHLRCT